MRRITAVLMAVLLMSVSGTAVLTAESGQDTEGITEPASENESLEPAAESEDKDADSDSDAGTEETDSSASETTELPEEQETAPAEKPAPEENAEAENAEVPAAAAPMLKAAPAAEEDSFNGAALLPEAGVSAQTPDVSGSKTASPTELTPNNRETTVTLKLPSGEYKNKYDIVFVMDSSTSTANNKVDFTEYALPLFNSLIEKNADLNIGVIKCRGVAFDTIALSSDSTYSKLVNYSEATAAAIKDGLNYTEADLKKLSSGTNMHGGLDMANDWLKEDTAVEDDHKYVIMLLDGKTYIWNDENDVPTSVYGQYMASKRVYPQPALGQTTIAYSKSAYRFFDGVNFFKEEESFKSLSFDEYFEKTGNFYTGDYAKLYASNNEELSNATKYDYIAKYAYKGLTAAEGVVVTHDVTNGSQYTYLLHKKYYEFTPNSDWSDLIWLQANPYTVEKDEDGNYKYTETVNPDFYQLHPDGLQKALYLTGHLWTEMQKSYHCASVIYNGWGGGSGLEIAKSFNEWLPENSEFSADISDADSLKKMFDSIREDILYMVSEGTVTDKIPSDFTLVENGNDTFVLTVNGKKIEGTQDGNTWTFGENYSVTYNPDENAFSWAINVPIENANPLTLSYKLRLNDGSPSGIYDTNISAVLDYISSDQTTGTFEFEIPKVTYKESQPTPTPTPAPGTDPTPKPTPTPDNVVTCQMAGYPSNYAWNEDAKACQPGFIDNNGKFHSVRSIPNTSDKGLMGSLITFLISDLLGIAAAYLLREH